MALRVRRILRGAPLTSISRFALPQYLYYRLKNGGNKPLVINAENESRRLSYADVLDQSTRLAEVLRARGVGPGDLVTVCSENSIEYVLPLLASMFIRATCVPVSVNYTSWELQHLLHITPPRVVFCTAATKDNVLDALRRLQHQGMTWPALLVLMPDFNGVEIQLEGFHTLSQVLKSTQFSPKFRPSRTPDPSTDVALIMCSSGTTGLPKAVQLTQTNVLVNLAVREHRQFNKKDKSPYLPGHLPMFHGIGMMMLLGTISQSATLVVMPFFSLRTFLRIIQDYKINSIRTVPPILHQLAHSDLVQKYDLSSLTNISCGAAPLSAELQEAVSKRLHVKDVHQAYGLTEITVISLWVPNGKNKFGTSGCVVPGLEGKVIDDGGNLLGPHERGELCFRGPLVMKGYVNDPEATAQVIDEDGWLHTGDVGYYDEDECFFVVDRIKELIKYKGFQVPPAELEGVLQTHPGVADAAVVGVPNAEAGELPLAFVVRKDPAVTEKELIDFVAKDNQIQRYDIRMIRKSKIIHGGPVVPLTDLSLPLYLLKRLKDGGDKPFAINAENESRKLSYAEVLDQSTRLAEVLRARGVGPGDLVTVCSENSIEFIIPVLATLFVGAACSPLSYVYTPREMQHLLRLTAPRVIFLSHSARKALLEALKQATTIKWPLLVLMPNSDGSQVQMEGFELMTEMLKTQPSRIDRFQPYQPKDPDQCVALVLCSSGTTGLPKGVQLSHTNIFSNLTNRQHKRFVIEDGTLSLLYAAPPLVQQLVVSDLVSQYDLSSLQFIASGAAPLSAQLQDSIMKKLNLKEIRQGYGLTECSLATIVPVNGLNKSGSSGCVFPGLEVKVIDESGQLLGPHERGELCFRGPHVMMGYINDPQATAQAIDKEGWLHTGDVGYYDEDECFFIVDRIKELINHPDFEMKVNECDFVSCHLPMFHAIGMLISMGTVARGLTLIVLPQFKFETFLRILQDYKMPVISAVPPIVQALAHSEVVAKYDLSNVKFMTSGAAPLSAELQDFVTKRLNQLEVRQSYGLTESTLGTLAVRNGLNKSGTSGCVVPGMEAKVIDLETGQMLGAYKNGELCFRGVLMAKGYMKNPEATAQTIDKEGWLHTGDVGYYDEDECFFVVDRIKELIKYKGFQVPPAELEGVLQTHPGVADAAVVGVPNAEAGELPLAFVVRKDPAVTEKELIEFVAKNVSPQKRLRGGVRFIEAIPKTQSGKILRRDLRQLLQSKI
ncbi:hypothetical protein B566_EDAN002259 [Ephemera danica]|nr:hypothetical protein B566_EDAN002259 [Ephemera danica]